MADDDRRARKRTFYDSDAYDPEIHGESSDRTKRSRRDRSGSMSSDDEDGGAMKIPPEMFEHMSGLSEDRDTFYNLATITGNVALGPTTMEYKGTTYVLRTGQLHPKLWKKYMDMLMRDMRIAEAEFRKNDNMPGEHAISIEEFIRDTQIRLDRDMAGKVFLADVDRLEAPFAPHVGNIEQISRGANRYPVQFGVHVSDKISSMIMAVFHYQMLQWNRDTGYAMDAETLWYGVVDARPSHGRGVESALHYSYGKLAYWASTFDNEPEGVINGIKVRKLWSLEGLAHIMWAVMTDDQKSRYYSCTPTVLAVCSEMAFMEKKRIESERTGETRIEVKIQSFLAELMRDRNRTIRENPGQEKRPLCPEENIAEMFRFSVVDLHGNRIKPSS